MRLRRKCMANCLGNRSYLKYFGSGLQLSKIYAVSTTVKKSMTYLKSGGCPRRTKSGHERGRSETKSFLKQKIRHHTIKYIFLISIKFYVKFQTTELFTSFSYRLAVLDN